MKARVIRVKRTDTGSLIVRLPDGSVAVIDPAYLDRTIAPWPNALITWETN